MEEGSKTKICCQRISGVWVHTMEKLLSELHLRLRDIILNWAVQIETILDVNEMLLDLQEATMDAVN